MSLEQPFDHPLVNHDDRPVFGGCCVWRAPMKIRFMCAALAAATFAAVPANAHGRAASCQHVSHRPALHRAAYHPVRARPALRHLAASSGHGVRYAGCGCGHAARARIVYEEREFVPLYRRPAFVRVAYFRPHPIFYRPRMIYYGDDFPVGRFHRRPEYGGGFRDSYWHHRDRDFERRHFAMRDDWRR
jgi:hypothetical protein